MGQEMYTVTSSVIDVRNQDHWQAGLLLTSVALLTQACAHANSWRYHWCTTFLATCTTRWAYHITSHLGNVSHSASTWVWVSISKKGRLGQFWLISLYEFSDPIWSSLLSHPFFGEVHNVQRLSQEPKFKEWHNTQLQKWPNKEFFSSGNQTDVSPVGIPLVSWCQGSQSLPSATHVKAEQLPTSFFMPKNWWM